MPLLSAGGIGKGLVRPSGGNATTPTLPALKPLSIGVNLANQYIGTSPSTGNSGLPTQTMTEGDWVKLSAAGVDHVRIPVAGARVCTNLGFTAFKPGNAAALDSVVDQARAHGIKSLIDVHPILGSEDPMSNTISNIHPLMALLIGRYGNREESVLFSPLNEPSSPEFSNTSSTTFQAFHNDIVPFMRSIDPYSQRKIMINGQYKAYYKGFNNTNPINNNDPNLYYEIHYYESTGFTHQKSNFYDPSTATKSPYRDFPDIYYPTDHNVLNAAYAANDPTNNTEERTIDWNRAKILADLTHPRTWAASKGVRFDQFYLGEFGVFKDVPEDFGIPQWTGDMVSVCKQLGIPFAGFAYGSVQFPFRDTQLSLLND